MNRFSKNWLPKESPSIKTKLREFPFSRLPKKVVVPTSVLSDLNGRKIIGYSMEFLRNVEPLMSFTERDFRERGGIDNNTMLKLFGDLYPTVSQIHSAGVVIADFNSLNVLKQGDIARIVDADSMQNSKYLSRLFTTNYVDPRLCDPKLTSLILVKPHDELSDWYGIYDDVDGSTTICSTFGVESTNQRILKKGSPLDARPLTMESVF